MIKVLLIEDNLADVRLTQEMLNEAREDNFSFHYTSTLKDGLDKIKKEKYDVILLDLGLPDSTGVESVQDINEVNSTIPVIVFTIIGSENLGFQAIDLGAQDYLIKDETTAPLLIKTIKYSISRKKFEEQLLQNENKYRVTIEGALKEKEVLLKELNHRVKNNLQMIYSLISLQTAATGENGSLEIFDDIKNRIRSLGLIHDKLSKSPTYSSINFEEYCKELITNIRETLHEKKNKVELDYKIEHIDINYEIVSAVGLITNEIITNSFKYAFPKDQSGTIYVNLKKLDNHKVELKFGDTGIGLPMGTDIKKCDTLGLQLISLLSEQIGAELKLKTNPGTEYTLVFSPGKQN